MKRNSIFDITNFSATLPDDVFLAASGDIKTKQPAVNLQTTVKLEGLEPDCKYINEIDGKEYYGAELMQFGVPIKTCGRKNDYDSELLLFTRNE